MLNGAQYRSMRRLSGGRPYTGMGKKPRCPTKDRLKQIPETDNALVPRTDFADAVDLDGVFRGFPEV
jgi:hypothetical protein